MLRVLKRFTAMPANRRGISVEAVVALGVARFLVLAVPIRWIARRLERQTSGIHVSPAAADAIAREVGWAVRAAAPKTPWKSACLAQALAGKWMLGRRGLHGTIRLGVAKDADRNLHAHAWLYIGDRIVTGGGTAGRFTAVGDIE
jgi:transglutaminase superfamily protein